MNNWIARVIAYVFVGSFCVAGPLCLAVALGSALQRAVLIYTGVRAEGTVVAKARMGSTRITYAPVFQFTASDGRSYTVNSDVYGQESDFKYGQHLTVLYRAGHPQSARINAFGPLWTYPLVFGAVGTGFSFIPALMLENWIRRRHSSGGEPNSTEADQTATASPGFRWIVGMLLIAGGLVLLCRGFGLVSSD